MTDKPNILVKNVLEQLSINDQVGHQSDLKLLNNAKLTSDKALFRAINDRALKLDVRQAACWAVGRRGGVQAIRALLNVLRQGESGLAFEAAKSLIALDAKQVIPQISQIVKRGKTPTNRAAAAYTLGFLGDGSVSQMLIEVLNGTDTPEVRSHAAEALGHIADENTTESLVRGLKDRSAKVRFWCVFALGEIGDLRALSPLQHLASEDKSTVPKVGKVSTEARRAIKRLKAQSGST
jgi:HEAT repeat protein